MDDYRSKRIRLDTTQTTELHENNKTLISSILADDYVLPIELETVYISKIEEKKTLSSIIAELSKCLPINKLQHVKRVHSNKIILCLRKDVKTLEEYNYTNNEVSKDEKIVVLKYLMSVGIKKELSTKLIENLCTYKIPSRQVKLRWQYEQMNSIWPCKFHPNKTLEDLYNNTFFSTEEIAFHKKILSTITIISKLENKNIGICVDPRFNSIVAIAPSRVEKSPIFHSPMVLIDLVARTQNKGVWNYEDEKFVPNTVNQNFQGIMERHKILIRDEPEMLVTLGAELISNTNNYKVNEKPDDISSQHENNLNKYGPYLCTGYDLYLQKEPCLMCAMALVHSRVRRLFYIEPSKNGVLGSKLKLHTNKSLNHHFLVFQCEITASKFDV